jgi:lipopolysaccharide export system protein LptC
MARESPPPWLRQTLGHVIRLGLPLGALALMSTIFLASRHVDPNRAAALSNLNLEEITREPRIGQARIATVTPENAALTIAARTIRSVADLKTRAPLHLKMDAPEGTLDFSSGTGLRFAADEGEITQAGNRVTLDQNVTLQSDSGYALRMQTLHTDLQGSVFESVGPVSGTGPAGQIAAQTLTVTALAPRDSHPNSGYLLAFAGDVRLLYQPQQ